MVMDGIHDLTLYIETQNKLELNIWEERACKVGSFKEAFLQNQFC